MCLNQLIPYLIGVIGRSFNMAYELTVKGLKYLTEIGLMYYYLVPVFNSTDSICNWCNL